MIVINTIIQPIIVKPIKFLKPTPFNLKYISNSILFNKATNLVSIFKHKSIFKFLSLGLSKPF